MWKRIRQIYQIDTLAFIILVLISKLSSLLNNYIWTLPIPVNINRLAFDLGKVSAISPQITSTVGIAVCESQRGAFHTARESQLRLRLRGHSRTQLLVCKRPNKLTLFITFILYCAPLWADYIVKKKPNIHLYIDKSPSRKALWKYIVVLLMPKISARWMLQTFYILLASKVIHDLY